MLAAPHDDDDEDDVLEEEGEEVPFALAPGLATTGVVNYSNRAVAAQYKEATKSLNTPFGCTPDTMVHFIRELEDRAKISGWMDILQIPPNPAFPNALLTLTQSYGILTLEQVRAHALTYVYVRSRAAQDSAQMYECIKNSLTTEGYDRVKTHVAQYQVHGFDSGVAFLKVVIRESHIDTKSTTRNLRKQLTNLHGYMVSVGYDITKFNEHVSSLVDKLAARGEVTDDLLTSLFDAYEGVTDLTFKQYMATKQDQHDEGAAITPATLMHLADNKYKTLIQDQKWMATALTVDQTKRIIALEARIDGVVADKTDKEKSSNNKTGTSPGQKQGSTTTGKVHKAGMKFKPANNRKRPPWMTVPPKPGEPDKKEVNGKKFVFCKKHKAWGAHSTDVCEGVGLARARGATTPVTQGRPTLRLAHAYAAIMHESDESECDI